MKFPAFDEAISREGIVTKVWYRLFSKISRDMAVLNVGGPLGLTSYTVASVPAAADYTNTIIYVSNETGGATIAFSDGTNWRRVQDRAIIS